MPLNPSQVKWDDAPAIDTNQVKWDAAPTASTADKIVGSRLGRAVLGASGVISGPLQLGANLGALGNKYVVAPVAEALGAKDTARYARQYGSKVADTINTGLQKVEQSKLRGQKALGTEGFDAMGLLGSAAPMMLGAPSSAFAGGLGNQVARGAGLGAFFGATAPVTSGNSDFWANKAITTGIGAGLGGGIPLATAGVKKVVGGLADAGRVIFPTKGNIDSLKKDYYTRLIGKENISPVVKSLESADEIIAGGKPTAAEALSNNPLGSPIQAQQRVTAATSGGPSGAFGQRLYEQGVARTSAELERDAVTAPMRKAALDRATNISARTVNNEMLQIVADPQVQAVKPARVFLEGIAKDAIDAAKSGDAESLYSVRKYITDLIDKRVDSPDNVAGFASTKLQAMKRVIDNAIENGGAGGSWRAYLNEYATRSQAIDKSVERAAGMYKPAQITSVPGGAAIAESTATHLPNLLSRSAMIANYIARAARNNVEPKLDASMAQDFLNPQMMAEVLKKADPASRSWLQKALATQAKKAVVVLPVQAVSRGLGQ